MQADQPSTRELLDSCVHCGFCLPACPTYELWGQEMDSPRGRIMLMDMVEKGELEMDSSVATHIDRCLGCLACVPACPSGVRYDLLIERARAERLEDAPEKPRAIAVGAMAFTLFTRPRLLRTLSLPLTVVRPTRLAPRLSLGDLRARPPRYTPPRGELRMSAALLEGCVQQVFFGRVNAAAAQVLAADGCECSVPEGQGCCGALALHQGREEEARERAQATVEAFAGAERVVVTAAGCGSAMKGYGELLGTPEAQRFSESVRDVTELLAELGPRAPREPLPAARVVYQDACHLNHGQGISREPRELLAQIPGIELVEIDRAGMCCGSAGLYNLTQPEAAHELGLRKARDIIAVEPDIVATANPGCALQLSAALRELGHGDIPIVHPAELLAESIGSS